MAIILVTDTSDSWLNDIAGVEQVDARDYLTKARNGVNAVA